MSSHAPYSIEYHPADALACLREDENIFAIVRSGGASSSLSPHAIDFEIDLPSLGSDRVEAWRSDKPLKSGSFEHIRFKHSDTFIFGFIRLDESSFESLAFATKSAYQQIHDALETTGFPSLLRMWNIFPQINKSEQDLERYRSFCLGRHQAMSSWHFLEEQLPAASAVGSHDGKLLIYFLAARQPGIQIENPRQISAYHYPMRYGPKSPSFSRATLKNWGESQHLYISGTASIVGHETLHAGDYQAQLTETVANINTIIEQANNMYALPCKDISELNGIRVYIRHREHADEILKTLRDITKGKCQISSVLSDICRSDLLLEIEGFFTN